MLGYVGKIHYMKTYCRMACRSICLTVLLFMLTPLAMAQVIPGSFTDLANTPAGVFYSYSGFAQACPAQCTNYAVFSGSLPPGLALNPSNGIVSGVPTVPGQYTFELRASFPPNGTALQNFRLTVMPLIVAGAPISAASLLVTMIALATVGLAGMRQLGRV
jgi:hypothetical protein